jgi:hypothetical protein
MIAFLRLGLSLPPANQDLPRINLRQRKGIGHHQKYQDKKPSNFVNHRKPRRRDARHRLK